MQSHNILRQLQSQQHIQVHDNIDGERESEIKQINIVILLRCVGEEERTILVCKFLLHTILCIPSLFLSLRIHDKSHVDIKKKTTPTS